MWFRAAIPRAAIPSIRYFRITNNNNHPSYSIQLLFNQRPIWLVIVSSTQLLVNKDFFRISILNLTTDAGNGGLIPLFCNVQHSSARVNLRVGLLLDRSLVSSVLHATVRTFKPENLRNFFLNLGFYQR